MVLNENLIIDIIKYYENYNIPLEKISFTINNENNNYAYNINYAKTLIYEIDLNLKNITKRCIRKNGNEDKPIKETLKFG